MTDGIADAARPATGTATGRGADAAAADERQLRIVVAHNTYRDAGGEDAVVAAETALLQAAGHEVIALRRDNADIDESRGRLGLAAEAIWSQRAHAELREMVVHQRPDVVHVHNTLPQLSPALHWAAHDAGAAVVQTLHNFRLACPQAMFLRDGRPCEDCLGRAPLPAIRHACYRGSRVQTAVVASMLVVHRAAGTWRNKVDRFIALSEFSRGRFVAAGIAAQRLVVKPNFVAEPGLTDRPRRGFLFAGRLAPEKGIAVLAAAFATLGDVRLRVAGSGSEAQRLAGIATVDCLGIVAADRLRDEMATASALVLPSVCYENFPRTVVEAYACGLPVIASRLGALAELVEDGVTGLHFRAGDGADLARVLRWAVEHPAAMEVMGRRARLRYEQRYTPERNMEQLLSIYRAAIGARRLRGPAR